MKLISYYFLIIINILCFYFKLTYKILETLLNFLTSIQPISNRLQQYLIKVLKEKEYKKKNFLLKQGQVCRNIYFVKKGLLRCFYLEDGNEISSWFMKAGDVVISVESFYKQKPSKEHIQALEDTIVFYNRLY